MEAPKKVLVNFRCNEELYKEYKRHLMEIGTNTTFDLNAYIQSVVNGEKSAVEKYRRL